MLLTKISGIMSFLIHLFLSSVTLQHMSTHMALFFSTTKTTESTFLSFWLITFYKQVKKILSFITQQTFPINIIFLHILLLNLKRSNRTCKVLLKSNSLYEFIEGLLLFPSTQGITQAHETYDLFQQWLFTLLIFKIKFWIY